MPNSFLKPCKRTGCPNATNLPDGYCHKCRHHVPQRDYKQEYKQRTKNHLNLYGRQWRGLRLLFLQDNPYCASCLKYANRYTPAKVVDHIKPHRGDRSLFWNQDNWQALCKKCHDAKTATEDRQKTTCPKHTD